jgi:hypothetical protein
LPSSANNGNDPDLIYIDQSLNIAQEKSSTHVHFESTHIEPVTHVEERQQQLQLPPRRHHRVTAEDIQALAGSKFQCTGKGLTFKDLLKSQYKRAYTKEQAQDILHYHKKRGNLYTNSCRTKPQQYFCNEVDAEQAALYNSTITHIEPSGSSTSTATKKATVIDSNKAMSDELKAQNLAQAVDLAASNTDGKLPIGMHNIHIHVNLHPLYVSEAYYERLKDVKPQNTRQKGKLLEIKIDGYNIKCLVYPKGKIMIAIPCSNNPFPISPNAPERTTSDFNHFIAQIRGFLCSQLSDYRGRIVPPIHDSSWRLVHADLNWDVPTTTLNFLSMCDIQVTRLINDVILRVYRKMQNREPHIRVEKGTHPFSNDATSTSFDEFIGPTIIAAVKDAQKELLSATNTPT